MYDPHLGFDPAIPFAILGFATPCAIYVWRSIVNRKKKAEHLAELNRQQEELMRAEWEEEQVKLAREYEHKYDQDELDKLIDEFTEFKDEFDQLIELIGKDQIDLRKFFNIIDNIEIKLFDSKPEIFNILINKAFKKPDKIDKNKAEDIVSTLEMVQTCYSSLQVSMYIGEIPVKTTNKLLNEYISSNISDLDNYNKVEKFLDNLYKIANKRQKEI